MVRFLISLDLRTQRKKLIRKKPINELAVRGKTDEFRITLQNRYSALPDEADLSVQAMNDNLTSTITESAKEVVGKRVRRDTGKLSQETNDLIRKRQSMKASNPTQKIELAELSKVINRRKVADIRKYYMERIEHALKNGGSLKAVKRKLGIGKKQIYALSDKQADVTTNMDKIVKVAEYFYRDLWSSRDNQKANGKGSSPEELNIPPVTKEEVKEALEAMKSGKAAGEDQPQIY